MRKRVWGGGTLSIKCTIHADAVRLRASLFDDVILCSTITNDKLDNNNNNNNKNNNTKNNQVQHQAAVVLVVHR